MFSVKQHCNNQDGIWPNVTHVNVEYDGQRQPNHIRCLVSGGGEIEFGTGRAEQIIYVMNENGSTVGRYDMAVTDVEPSQLNIAA